MNETMNEKRPPPTNSHHGPPKPASRVQRRAIETGVAIAMGSPEQIAYQHTVLCQTSLPYRNPGQDRMCVCGKTPGRNTLAYRSGGDSNPRHRRVCPTWTSLRPQAPTDPGASERRGAQDKITGNQRRGQPHGLCPAYPKLPAKWEGTLCVQGPTRAPIRCDHPHGDDYPQPCCADQQPDRRGVRVLVSQERTPAHCMAFNPPAGQ